ncbi:MAG TPA: DUF262 domain-containing protein [Solirubrobacterales bacterium]
MDGAIDAKAQSFEAIFDRNVRYLVPVYQRRYAWARERQWEPFWKDVLEVVKAYVSAVGEGGAVPPAEELPNHFLGAIVVKLMQFGTGQLELREIIDGQQRLTTIQLLIGAAAEVLEELGASEQAEALRDLTANRRQTQGDPEAVFKVWPTKHDRAAFRAVMSGSELDKELEKDRIAQAHRYFCEAIAEWAESIPEPDRELHLQALEAVIRTQLKIVWIDLDKRDNSQVIFETLNDRGAPLNAIDLVKNFVFQREHEHGGADTEDLYEQHWVWIEDDWWQEKVRLGRLDRVRADVFLQHWLQMRLGIEVNSDYLFKSFTKMFDGDDSPDVAALIPEFAEDSRIYRSFSAQPAGTARAGFFSRLKVLNTTTPFPLVLFLFKQEQVGTLSGGEVDRCLATIEDYLVRRMLMRGSAQGYNRTFTELVKDVRQDPGRAPEVLEQQLTKMEGASRNWPRDGELKQVLTQSRAYGPGAIAQERLLDVLWEVERRRLRTDKHEDLQRPEKLQIEHVMPRSWTAHWPLPDGDPAGLDERRAERDHAVNLLGNLTLVTHRLNPAMSNSAWAKKQPALSDHSLLAMNRQLVDRYAEGFDESSIAERGELLAEHILAVWPGPPATAPVEREPSPS